MKKFLWMIMILVIVITTCLIPAAAFADEGGGAGSAVQVKDVEVQNLILTPEDLKRINASAPASGASSPLIDIRDRMGIFDDQNKSVSGETYSEGRTADTTFKTGGLAASLLEAADRTILGAPNISVQWEKAYGGYGADYIHSIAKAHDGGYYIAGSTTTGSSGGDDFYVLKLSASGAIEGFNITSIQGHTYNEWVQSVKETPDWGYIAAGAVDYNNGDRDVLVVKYDRYGNISWAKSFGGYNLDGANAVAVTSDGGYVIAGYGATSSTNQDMWLIKLGSDGTRYWDYKYGYTGGDNVMDVKQTSDGGFAMVGYTSYDTFGGSDIYLVKTNYAGIKEWDDKIGTSNNDEGYSLIQNSSGHYIITGDIEKTSTDYEIILCDIEPYNGDVVWSKGYGGTGEDYGYCVEQASDSGYVIAASYGTSSSNSDAYIIKTDSSGVKQWDKLMGGSSTDYVSSIVQANDGGYVAAGITYSYGGGGEDGYAFKLTASDPLTVTGSDPVNGAVNVPLDKTISVSFGRSAMSGPAFSSIVLKDSSYNPISATLGLTGNSLTVTPNARLQPGQQYTLTIPSNAVVDVNGTGLASNFTLTFTTQNPVAAPTASPAAGTYSGTQSVTLSCATSGASIYYTTDGSAPTTSSMLYTGPIMVSGNTTIKAIAAKSGMVNSSVATFTYVIMATVAAPTASPAAGTYSGTQSVTLSCATSGASIYYTKDGSTPTTSSTLYSNPISISSNTTIKAMAVKAGMTNSAVATFTYIIIATVAAPTASPVAGTYSGTQSVTLSCATSGASIYYTTDGSAPTTSSMLYTGPITVSSNTTIKAIAAKSGMANSSVATFTYVIMATVAAPTASPAAGTYSGTQSVTLSCATSGASIYYTTDGSTPTTSSTLYASPIVVSTNTTIKAIAVKAGMTNSAVATFAYVISPDRLLGDANGNGVIEITDALRIAKAAAKLVVLTPEDIAAANVNGDSSVDVLDALRIAKYLAHLIPSL